MLQACGLGSSQRTCTRTPGCQLEKSLSTRLRKSKDSRLNGRLVRNDDNFACCRQPSEWDTILFRRSEWEQIRKFRLEVNPFRFRAQKSAPPLAGVSGYLRSPDSGGLQNKPGGFLPLWLVLVIGLVTSRFELQRPGPSWQGCHGSAPRHSLFWKSFERHAQQWAP